MAPSLTNGSINKILNGEDVQNPIIQILGCKKCPGEGRYRYRLLISDGVTSYSYATLRTQLNNLVETKELEKFAVVRVEKYVCNQVQPDRKVIFLLNLTVVTPASEINERIGNPISSAQCSNMAPTLTKWSIAKIFNGEDSHKPVVQILYNWDLLHAEGKWGRYRLIISDSVTSYSFTTLGTRLNQMAANKELEKFTVVRVNEYVCEPVKNDYKLIILKSLTVLAPGNEVNKVLGNPYPYTPVDSTENPTENKINGTVQAGTISFADMAKCLNLETHTKSLSSGSINKILKGENVPNAVLQILGVKRITCEGFNWFRFLISDGVTGYPFAILSRNLNDMAIDRELERYTIIKVDKWSLAQADDKTILLSSLKVLVPGNEINEILGNPFNSNEVSSAAGPSEENGMKGVSAPS